MRHAWLLFGGLVFAGCTGSTEGEAGRTNYGNFERLARSLPLICEQTEACYGTFCEGPAEGGLMAEWLYDPDGAHLTLTCLQELEGQYPALPSWADCVAEASENEAGCLSECPATVDDCLTVGNAAVELCNRGAEAERMALAQCMMDKCSGPNAPPACDL